jgi:serine/threonine-protein kinase
MGEVYRADDLLLGQTVALKFLPAGLRSNSRWLARFQQEVRIARQVSHPLVCRVHDISEADGQPFLTMEYIDGENLASLLLRIGRLPEDKGIQLARQLCAGLAAAHARGVLHRDLKPRNIMIDGQGNARITDFGLAVLADSIPGAERYAGTPGYMAPEQVAGKSVTVKSDLYALGLVLYEMFTGKRVFKARSRSDLERLQATTEPAPPSSLVPGLDASLEQAILQCLEKDPEKRPASALAVAARLPGGNPLALALVEGRIPSPEMVADAQGEARPAPVLSVCLLIAVLAGIGCIATLADRTMLFRLVPLEKSPQSLTEKAREILALAGAREAPIDSRQGFLYDEEYLQTLTAGGTTEREQELRSGLPAAMYFWYRQSPQYLIPTGMGLRYYPGRVTPSDPPALEGGMAEVSLDTRGRLLEFVLTPFRDRPMTPAAARVDWPAFFDQAGLDWNRTAVSQSQWLPPVLADERYAWDSFYAERADLPVRVEAGTLSGQLVYFQVIQGSWARPDPSRGLLPNDSRSFEYVYAVLNGLLVAGGIWLASRNLRLKRGDQVGALRLAIFLFCAHMICMLLAADHVRSLTEEATWLMKAIGFAVFWAGSCWLLYLALEPYVRRRWPWRLVTWNRLLAGRIQDPLVGRDVLIGGVLGVCLTVLMQLQILVGGWRGLTPVPLLVFPGAFTNPPFHLLVAIPAAIEDSLQWFFFLFLLVLLTRKNWLAMGLGFVIVLIYYLVKGGQAYALDVLFVTLSVALGMHVALRYGLLALTVGLYYCYTLSQTPITLDLSTWYARSALLYMLAPALLAVYAFRISLAGRPLFREGFYEVR